jgi:cytochrome c oxidase subunit 2
MRLPVFNPSSPPAAEIARLFHGVLIMSYVIAALVAFLVGWALYKYRAQPGAAEPESQRHGHRNLEIAWTAIPLLVLTGVFTMMVLVMRSTEPVNRPRHADLQILGWQWWWQLRYPNGVIAANEIHIPTGKRLNVEVLGADVIHDFWVPELAPKMDAIPGRDNYIWLEADRPGTYLGTCAEYCGAEHAWMRIRVIAQAPADYQRWLAGQAATPPPPQTAEAKRGEQLFRNLTCINCHRIAGTPATATVGPDLTHVASRETLGAGVMNNTPENLKRWITNPQEIKPDVRMPNMHLTDEQAGAITAYLETLK